jgi:N-acylneuraminate cytidylyltransferase
VGVRPSEEDPRVLRRYFTEGAGVTRRQDAGRFLRINGNFYVWRTDFVRRLGDAWFDEGRHGMVEIPELRAFAIDYGYQAEMLQALLTAGTVTLPWLSD